MAHQSFADLVPGMEDVDGDQLGLRLVGTAVLGQLFDHFGWTACVLGIALFAVAVSVLPKA